MKRPSLLLFSSLLIASSLIIGFFVYFPENSEKEHEIKSRIAYYGTIKGEHFLRPNGVRGFEGERIPVFNTETYTGSVDWVFKMEALHIPTDVQDNNYSSRYKYYITLNNTNIVFPDSILITDLEEERYGHEITQRLKSYWYFPTNLSFFELRNYILFLIPFQDTEHLGSLIIIFNQDNSSLSFHWFGGAGGWSDRFSDNYVIHDDKLLFFADERLVVFDFTNNQFIVKNISDLEKLSNQKFCWKYGSVINNLRVNNNRLLISTAKDPGVGECEEEYVREISVSLSDL